MLRQTLSLALLMMLTAPSGCGKAPPEGLPGRWEIDMAATLAQARLVHATPADIESVRRTFDGGEATFTPTTVTLSLPHTPAATTFEYHLEGKDGECSILTLQGVAGRQRYCVTGSQLQIHDPSTPLVVVYRRA